MVERNIISTRHSISTKIGKLGKTDYIIYTIMQLNYAYPRPTELPEEDYGRNYLLAKTSPISISHIAQVACEAGNF